MKRSKEEAKIEKVFSGRDGDVMYETTSHRAVVDYQEILDACEAEPDPYGDTPWDDDCYYSHEDVRLSKLESHGHWEGDRWVPHYSEEDVAFVGAYDRRLIVVSKEDFAKQGIFKSLHAGGTAKQVAREEEAFARRRVIDQLVSWYANGWYIYVMWCKHWLVEHLGVGSSIGGVYEDAIDETRRELALEVCAELEGLGYTVTGRPTGQDRKEERREAKLWRIARNLGFDDVESYREWLRKPHGSSGRSRYT